MKTFTIFNCLAKAGISKDQQKSAQSDGDDPFKDLLNQTEKLGKFYQVFQVQQLKMSFLCTVPLLTDEELTEDMNNENRDDTDDGEDDDDDALLNPVCSKASDIWEALQVLYDYMPFSLSGEDIRQKFNALSISIDRHATAKMTQSDIRTFFQ